MKLFNIGSLSTSDICISNDPTVSRKHAQLFWDGKDLVVITDLGSLNGTYVNGNKISEPYKLKDLDVVKIGNSLLPWREYVHGDKTIFSTPNYSQTQTNDGKQVSENISNKKKKFKLKALNYILPIIAVLIVLFIYLSSEHRRLLGKWKNEETNHTYSFFKQSEFEHFINGQLKAGTFEANEGTLKLKYDRKDLPIQKHSINSSLIWNATYGFKENNYNSNFEIGLSFVIENLSSDTLIIHSIFPGEFFYPSYRDYFTSKVYLFKGDYRNILSDNTIPDYKYKLKGMLDFNKSNYTSESHITLDNIIIPPKEMYSLMILTNSLNVIYYNEKYADEDLDYNYSAIDENLKIYSGHSSTKDIGKDYFLLNFNNCRWLGEISYSTSNIYREWSYNLNGNDKLILDSLEFIKQ